MRAREDRQRKDELFRKWAVKYAPEINYMNTASSAQMQQVSETEPCVVLTVASMKACVSETEPCVVLAVASTKDCVKLLSLR